jgi:hypothetical protein
MWAAFRAALPSKSMSDSDIKFIIGAIIEDPTLALKECPEAPRSPVCFEPTLKGSWVRASSAVAPKTGMPPGRIGEVVMLYRDGVHVQLDELGPMSERIIGVDYSTLELFDFSRWLPLQAAAFLNWPSEAFAFLVSIGPEAVSASVNGTSCSSVLELLSPSAPASYWFTLKSWLGSSIREDADSLWWLIARSEQVPELSVNFGERRNKFKE